MLQEGDRVMAINGVDLENKTLDEANQMLEETGDVVTLRIEFDVAGERRRRVAQGGDGGRARAGRAQGGGGAGRGGGGAGWGRAGWGGAGLGQTLGWAQGGDWSGRGWVGPWSDKGRGRAQGGPRVRPWVRC